LNKKSYNKNMRKRLKPYLLTLILVCFMGVRCSGSKDETSSTASCTDVTETLGSPKTIEETVTLINSLPRPLSLGCFLNSLKAPLGVMAVNSTGSAQPAVDNANPRIFIIRNKLVLSVATAGAGRSLLELGELVGSSESFKGELAFPVEGTVTADQIVSQMAQTPSTSTCATCHGGERKVQHGTLGPLWASSIVRPNTAQKISYAYLRAQASSCDSNATPHRCDVLKAIYTKGLAEDVDFPY
jgi:hypothetical protein